MSDGKIVALVFCLSLIAAVLAYLLWWFVALPDDPRRSSRERGRRHA